MNPTVRKSLIYAFALALASFVEHGVMRVLGYESQSKWKLK